MCWPGEQDAVGIRPTRWQSCLARGGQQRMAVVAPLEQAAGIGVRGARSSCSYGQRVAVYLVFATIYLCDFPYSAQP